MTEWPSEHGQTAKIRPSDGCGGNAVPLAAEWKYHFHGFGTHLGNVGLHYVSSLYCPFIEVEVQYCSHPRSRR